MIALDNLHNIALLIDADNTQLSKLEEVIQEISKHGRIVVKRAYGNWRKDALKGWEAELKRLAIKAEQQFDYVTGKNATDIALVIDAMTLMSRNLYDGFVIVSSDSDFTPLAIHLHESGIYVMGVGARTTPESFKNSCDEFILLENIGQKAVASAAQPKEEKKNGQKAKKTVKKPRPEEPIDEIHRLLRLAWETYQEDDGFAFTSNAGSYIKRVKPDFDVRTFSFRKLTELIEAFPDKYETRSSSSGQFIKVYRCK